MSRTYSRRRLSSRACRSASASETGPAPPPLPPPPAAPAAAATGTYKQHIGDQGSKDDYTQSVLMRQRDDHYFIN